MSLSRIWTIARLELMQRLRSMGWYSLLSVFVVALIIVTVLSFMVFANIGEANAGVYSVVVNFVLLLVVLVSPTLSGNAINGDRESATLAPIQVTAATTGDIMLGKLLAAVVTGAVFLLIAVPFLGLGMLGGGVSVGTFFVSILVLLAEIIVVATFGVALSGLIARPLFSIAATYLTVAALVIGTPIAFGLGGAAVQTEATQYQRPYDESTGEPVCDGTWDSYTVEMPRFDYVWGFLAANPFVVLADATPTNFADGYPNDLFGQVKIAVRQAQLPPQEQRWDACAPYSDGDGSSPEQVLDETVPTWFVGLGLQVLIAGGLFAGAWSRTRTPARRLPPGTRIA